MAQTDVVHLKLEVDLKFESEDASDMFGIVAVPARLQDFIANALMRQMQQGPCHPSILKAEVQVADFTVKRRP